MPFIHSIIQKHVLVPLCTRIVLNIWDTEVKSHRFCIQGCLHSVGIDIIIQIYKHTKQPHIHTEIDKHRLW